MAIFVASFGLLSRLLLGLVFLSAGSAKLHDDRIFREFVGLAAGRWKVVALRVAKALPYFELLLGLTLLTGVFYRVAGAVAVVALLGFTTVAIRSIQQRRAISCGCFGRFADRPISWRTVGRNGILMLLGLSIAVDTSGVLTIDSLLSHADDSQVGRVVILAATQLAFVAAAVVAGTGLWLRGRALSPPRPRHLGELSRAWYGEDIADMDETFRELDETGTEP